MNEQTRKQTNNSKEQSCSRENVSLFQNIPAFHVIQRFVTNCVHRRKQFFLFLARTIRFATYNFIFQYVFNIILQSISRYSNNFLYLRFFHHNHLNIYIMPTATAFVKYDNFTEYSKFLLLVPPSIRQFDACTGLKKDPVSP